MSPAFIAVTRRKYIHVGSAPASLLETVTATNTDPIFPVVVASMLYRAADQNVLFQHFTESIMIW
jgi:hypothetical protein